MDDVTISQWAIEVGGDRHEWEKRVSGSEIKPSGKATGKAKGASLYRVKDLVAVALGGDIEKERLRKTKEEADRLALENAKTRGELVEIAVVQKLGEKVFVALRAQILAFDLDEPEKDKLLQKLLSLKDTTWNA